MPPTSRKKATTGKTRKKSTALRALKGALGHHQRRQEEHEHDPSEDGPPALVDRVAVEHEVSKLARTNAQQAPDQPIGWMPPCATVRQKVRSAPMPLRVEERPVSQPRHETDEKCERQAGSENRVVGRREKVLAHPVVEPAATAAAPGWPPFRRGQRKGRVRPWRLALLDQRHAALNQFMKAEVSRLMPR